jgi:hypothetical protein
MWRARSPDPSLIPNSQSWVPSIVCTVHNTRKGQGGWQRADTQGTVQGTRSAPYTTHTHHRHTEGMRDTASVFHVDRWAADRSPSPQVLHPKAKERMHALKGLAACCKRAATASSPAATCKQGAALTSPAQHACGCARPSCARFGQRSSKIVSDGSKTQAHSGTPNSVCMRSKAWRLAACRWLRLARLPPPASRVRRSRRQRNTLAAPPGLLAHASVT